MCSCTVLGSPRVGFVSAELHWHSPTTNTYNIWHRKFCLYYPNDSLFDSPSSSVFKKRVQEWLLQLEIEESEYLISVDSRWICLSRCNLFFTLNPPPLPLPTLNQLLLFAVCVHLARLFTTIGYNISFLK